MNDLTTSASFEVDISEDDVLAFAQLSGDQNPLHVDAEYAATTTYGRPIAHGALLVGLLSRMIGMHIPGRRALILSMRVSFPAATYYPARVRVTGRIGSFDNANGGTVLVTVDDTKRARRLLNGDVRFLLHGDAPASAGTSKAVAGNDSPLATERILVTGGTGGIGRTVVERLAQKYRLTCLSRQARPDHQAVAYRLVDLEAPDQLQAVLGAEDPRGYGAILHLSSAPITRAFISDDTTGLEVQLRHAIGVPVQLVRWARARDSGVRRVILVGSIAGSRYPDPQTGAYSLAKGAMEQLVRLLVADLAGIGATVNIIIPSAVPAGLNEGMSERARRAAEGRTATSRLTSSSDVADLVEFLLSPAAAQINGVAIPLDGGITLA